jgi:hypothetical protein
VQKHVLDHLRDYVVENVRVVGTSVEYIPRRGYETLESRGMRFRFYTHPDTRELCMAPLVPRKRRVKADVDPDRRVLSRDRELRRLLGVWYRIDVAPIPHDPLARARCFDVLERTTLDGVAYPARARDSVLWQTGRYAAKKRQLSTREILRWSLRRSR